MPNSPPLALLAARELSHRKPPSSSSVGPNDSRNVSSAERGWSSGLAVITTLLRSSSGSSSASSNAGLIVANLVYVGAAWPSAAGVAVVGFGSATACLNRPWISSPRLVISDTLPAITCCLKNVYGTVTRSVVSGNSSGTRKKFSTSSTSSIIQKRGVLNVSNQLALG